jgi:hypothetical protein
VPASMGFQVAENTRRTGLAAKHDCKAGPTETYLADSLRKGALSPSGRRRSWIVAKMQG